MRRNKRKVIHGIFDWSSERCHFIYSWQKLCKDLCVPQAFRAGPKYNAHQSCFVGVQLGTGRCRVNNSAGIRFGSCRECLDLHFFTTSAVSSSQLAFLPEQISLDDDKLGDVWKLTAFRIAIAGVSTSSKNSSFGWPEKERDGKGLFAVILSEYHSHSFSFVGIETVFAKFLGAKTPKTRKPSRSKITHQGWAAKHTARSEEDKISVHLQEDDGGG